MNETADTGTFTRWLAERLAADERADPCTVRVHGLHRAGVGQSSETLLCSATWSSAGAERRAEFVLRVQPTADGIFLEPDAVREFRVLAGLSAYPDVPVPRVRWCEADAALLGAPFFVMDKTPGVVPAGKPSIHQVGWLPTLGAEQRHQLARSAIGCLAALHRVEWDTTHRFLARAQDGPPGLEAHLAHTVRWHRWTTQGRDFAVVDTALAYVLGRQHEVDAGPPVLLWGDARLGNTMFDPDTLQVSAMLDWEVASIGPAGVDLAHWLVFDEFATSAVGVAPLPGYPDRNTVVAWYEHDTGRSVADLAYFEILQCLFLAITLIRQADAGVRAGRLSPDTRMAHDNTLTQMLARRLGLPVPELAADYLRHRQPTATKG